MATGTQPDAGQILNSLINSILLIDDNLAIHYANPAAQQLLAQSSRKLFGTPLPELLTQGADDILSPAFMTSFWVLVCFGVIGLPHTAVRCISYKDSKAVHRGIIIGTIVVAILMFGMHLAGRPLPSVPDGAGLPPRFLR